MLRQVGREISLPAVVVNVVQEDVHAQGPTGSRIPNVQNRSAMVICKVRTRSP